MKRKIRMKFKSSRTNRDKLENPIPFIVGRFVVLCCAVLCCAYTCQRMFTQMVNRYSNFQVKGQR
ncbi:hypothetical protein K431DRAFT_122886 [Polychaeton citri CBS 116435]|uniref:Uncharacterized protein n=1 Tax=Polychaeton citri CBS 116435 TaxID=1314669 RepID=A0A9P4Q417_9PEZI|nr:hypothetical protein K431DRAFT_122886 [Polychaeton citri CBS 116435]